MQTFDAILPAGGRIDAELSARVGTDKKALIRFGKDSILERTLKALRESGRVRRIVVIGSEEVRNHVSGKVSFTLEEATTAPENILNGLRLLQRQPDPPAKVLVATTDLPFLSGELVNDFVDSCPSDRDICVPLISKAAWDAAYPNTTATFVPLRDDKWTAGCVYLLDAIALEKSIPQMERVFANRKSVLGMAKLLGPKFLLLFLMKKLTVADVERKIQQMLGCTGAAVRGANPALAYDIDYLDDYEYALNHFEKHVAPR